MCSGSIAELTGAPRANRGAGRGWTLADGAVNKDFDRAYADLIHIYRAERMKPGRNPWLPEFVEGLESE